MAEFTGPTKLRGPQILKCLILAAGQGTRLKERGEVKPLVPLLGRPLIERVVCSAIDGGADEFYVVTGFEGETVTNFVEELAEKLEISITTIENENWQKENGYSVLKAKTHLQEPFFLLMSDHLFDPIILHTLQDHPPNQGEIVLAVDTNLTNPLIDLEDVTRVDTSNGLIRNIGKSIDHFSAFDTGIFLCTPALFGALEKAGDSYQDTTLSAGIRVLAKSRCARCLRTDRFWIDVDDEVAFKKAEAAVHKSIVD